MKLNNKRGISDVITTVLMILLVIAAIVILWAVVQRFVTQGTSTVAGTGECLTTTLTVTSATNTSGLTVRVTRGGDFSGNLTELRFFVDGTNVPMTGTKPMPGETMTFVSSTTLPNGWLDKDIPGKQVKVAAVIGTKTCEASDSIAITAA
ncbi:MAG: archaellin/type IV pilin N-terminal domain-containing protein [Candidatus Pacearchaeota archaeon]